MSLIWHITKKDLRHLWPWLALVTATILARYALGWHVEHHASPGPILLQRSETAEIVLLCLQLFISALFAAQLIHDDTANSDRAFWITRPIHGLRLVAAKILTLLLTLGFVPLITVFLWWHLHDFRFAEISAALPEFAARQTALIVCSFTIAIFTRTLGGFLLTAIAATVALWLLIAADTRWTASVPFTLGITHTILCLTLAAFAIGACTFLKYRRQNPRLPAAIMGLALFIGSAIAAWWPFDLVAPFQSMPTEPPAAAAITPRFRSTPSLRGQSAVFDFGFAFIPADHRAEIRSLKIRLRNENSTTDIPYASFGLSPVYEAIKEKTVDPRAAPNRFTYRVALPEISTPVTSLDFIARTSLRREETVADIPIATGAQAHAGPYTTRITFVHVTTHPYRSVNVLSTLPARLSPADGISETQAALRASDSIAGSGPIRRTRRLFLTGSNAQPIDAMVRQDSLQIDHVRYVFENFHYKPGADSINDHLVHVTYPLLGHFERALTFPPATRK